MLMASNGSGKGGAGSGSRYPARPELAVQVTTEPSLRKAMKSSAKAVLMATILLRPGGGGVAKLSPNAVTVPSALRTSPPASVACTSTTLDRPGGITNGIVAEPPAPQETTVPSDSNASDWLPPA